MEMKVKGQSCTICNKDLDLKPVTVNKAILDDFEFLVQMIDKSALQNALICATCQETINEAVNFKNSLLEKQKSCSLEETRQEINEKCVICYICKNITQPNSAMPLFSSCYENVISCMIPKKDLDNFVNPQICNRCHTSALNLHNITQFLSIYDVTKTTKDQLNIETVTDKEEFKIDIVDNCLLEDSKLNLGLINELKQEIKEEIAESQEDFLKKENELDWMDCKAESSSAWSFNINDKERSSTLHLGNLTAGSKDSIWTTSIIKTEMDYKEFSILNNEQIYNNDNFDDIEMNKCGNSEFQTKLENDLYQHTDHINLNDITMLQSQTKNNCYLVHENINNEKMFKCESCQFQTTHKNYLKKHMFIHKDINEIEFFKCEICQFQTSRKGNLKQHMLVHKDINEIELFKCEHCQYQTKQKGHLKHHMLIHKDTSEVELYKCQNCQFQTKQKGNLKRHMLIHKDTNEIKLYKCQNCQFQTKHKGYLQRHMLIHKDTNEVEMFKCQNCQFQTKQKSNLKHHMLIHKNTNEVELFKCDNCQFQTKRKGSLTQHMLIHEDNMFKCQHCQYQTRRQSNLNRHMLIHKHNYEVEMFKCEKCQFQTKLKCNLKQHMLIHKDTNEVEMFKCQICDYQTKYKYYLNTHIINHGKCKKIEIFKCQICDYQTKYKNVLKKHILVHKN